MTLKYIFDLDHCLYQDASDKAERYAIAAAKAAIEMGAPLEFEAARLMAAGSFRAHRSELVVFERDFGLDHRQFVKRYHHHALAEFTGTFTSVPRVRDAFNVIAAADKLVLTHSTSEWAGAVLAELGMMENMHESHILYQDHPLVDFRSKSRSEDLFEDVFDFLECSASDVVMFDDLDSNLAIPYRKGATTVLVHWGKAASPAPAHVTRQVVDIAEYFALQPM